ncbi:Transposase IS4 [Popillia japonica]|uniref:Transposase IS4 n=1 Tax=Popillia japonica TaxID=7064 RepID=A0AAW1N1Y1_POPJA
MDSCEAEQKRLEQLMEECLTMEDEETDQIEDEESADEVDIVEEQKCLTMEDEEADQIEDEESADEVDIVEEQRPKSVIRRLTTPLKVWEYFINAEILSIIMETTNKMIQSVACNYARERDARFTTTNEIRAIIGLLYIAGTYKANHLNLEDLWASNGQESCLARSASVYGLLIYNFAEHHQAKFPPLMLSDIVRLHRPSVYGLLIYNFAEHHQAKFPPLMLSDIVRLHRPFPPLHPPVQPS